MCTHVRVWVRVQVAAQQSVTSPSDARPAGACAWLPPMSLHGDRDESVGLVSFEPNARREPGNAGANARASAGADTGAGADAGGDADAVTLTVGAEEARLVAAARADRQAFAAIYLRYADRLYRYALARSGSAALAEDVVSETMLAALEGLGRFDARRGTLAGWLFGIATNRLAERTRRQARWLRAADRLTRQHPTSSADDTLDSTLRGETAQVVARLLDTLDERDRQIVLLHYSAELTSSEIGEALDMRPGTVRQRLARALRAMQQRLPREPQPAPATKATPPSAQTPPPLSPTRRASSAPATDPDDHARWRRPTPPTAEATNDADTTTTPRDTDTRIDGSANPGRGTGSR